MGLRQGFTKPQGPNNNKFDLELDSNPPSILLQPNPTLFPVKSISERKIFSGGRQGTFRSKLSKIRGLKQFRQVEIQQ